jgi:ABC-type transport system substrate-binding protein
MIRIRSFGWVASCLLPALTLLTFPACAATVRTAFVAGEHGVDPARHVSALSLQVQDVVYQRLLGYRAGAQGPELVPMAAAALPAAGDGGRRFEFVLREGAHFEATAGRGAANATGRPVTARDVAWSIRRLAAPSSTAPTRELLLDAIVGLRALAARWAATGSGDELDVAGIRVVDERTIRFELAEPDYDFPHLLAMTVASILPREIAEVETRAPLLGSGPFAIESWDREAGRIVLRRKTSGPSLGFGDVTRVEIALVADEAARGRLLDSGAVDYLAQPASALARELMADGATAQARQRRGLRLHRAPVPEVIYYYINQRDPVLGGNSDQQRALRRAILQSYDVAEEIRTVRAGGGRVGASVVPPEVAPQLARAYPLAFNPTLARRELDAAGFRPGADGWRRTPDGRELAVVFSSEPLDLVRPFREVRRRGLAAIGLKMETREQSVQQNLRDSEGCGLAFWGSAWQAAVPTPAYFLGLLYGPNIGRGINLACFESAEYDRLFERARGTVPGPERDRLYERMLQIAAEEGVWQIGAQRMATWALGERVVRFEPHALQPAPWLHMAMSTPSAAAAPGSLRAVELTFLKSADGERERLKRYIVDNWFAMDRIAKAQGLMDAFTVWDSGSDEGPWNLLVSVTYRDARGYAGIAEAFEAIRRTHTEVRIDGKSLRDLGRIVDSRLVLEDPAHETR